MIRGAQRYRVQRRAQRVRCNAGLAGDRRANLNGLTLEGIVPVRMPALDELQSAGAEIEREEQDAPALVLPDVNVLVRLLGGKDAVTAANHDMPEGDGEEAKRKRR